MGILSGLGSRLVRRFPNSNFKFCLHGPATSAAQLPPTALLHGLKIASVGYGLAPLTDYYISTGDTFMGWRDIYQCVSYSDEKF